MKTFDFSDTGGLFDHFEVNREPFWPRVWWLLAGSGVWHLVLIALIVLIPPVRDAFSITALFSGAGFVDRPYKHTDISDADIIEFPQEKFHYPEGYFAMDQQGFPSPQLPAVPPAFTPRPVTMKATPLPTPSPAASPSPGASPQIAANTSNTNSAAAKSSPSPNQTPDEKAIAQAQKDLEAASKKTGIDLPQEGEINKRPFTDLATYATQLRDQGKLDFDKPFEISIDSQLDKDGKLVNGTVSKHVGDDTLVDLGKKLVEAMNDSGILFYLKKINEDKPGTKVVFLIKQDGNEVVATVESEVSSGDSARKLAAGFAVMLAAGAKSREGKSEEPLLKSTKVSAEANKIIFSLTIPHQEVVDIVKKGMATPTPTATPKAS